MTLNELNPDQVKAMTTEELKVLADDVRHFLIDSVSRTGGHIGANLGTVDLTIALHKLFDSPRDKIIWDTGHQGYTHKILTGRADMFSSLNTFRGMNRFVTRSESEHDIVEASHAGTSISIALGLALANRVRKVDDYAIAVIGDGSLCEGLALEALNQAADEKDVNLIIVLNDNGFAISPGKGALHNYLQTLTPGGKRDTVFSSLGLAYLGPVDGHDIPALLEALNQARHANKVPVIHVKTEKGYGLPPAKTHPNKLHFSFPFNPETGESKHGFAYRGYQDVAARVIGEEMGREESIVAITPSTLYATGLQPVFDKFPERCFDPGMEEQHAMTMTVGLARNGCKPVIFYQSTFMQRAYDQLFHDVCFMNLPTLILTVRTGFSGYDNPTHHGIYEFSYLRSLPNLRVLYPKDGYELERMVRENLRELSGPTLISMPYGPVDEFDATVLDEPKMSFEQAEVVTTGRDLLLITVGHKYGEARKAARELKKAGIDCGLVNLRYLKPLPENQLLELMAHVPRVVSVEESVLEGGIGSALASFILDHKLGCDLLRIGIPCKFVEPGSNEELSALYGLDARGIVSNIKKRWFKHEISSAIAG